MSTLMLKQWFAKSEANLKAHATTYSILLIAIVYLSTLCRTLYWYDSAELSVAAHELGIPHPTGYPFFTLLAKYFSLFSPREPIRGIHSLSLLCTLMTMLLFIRFMEMRKVHSAVIAAALVLFAGSSNLWRTSIVAEVYTLNLLMLMLILVSEQYAELTNDRRFHLLSAFLLGLGLGNHVTLTFAMPGLLFRRLKQRKSIRRAFPVTSLLLNSLFFTLGLSVYLYLPIRAQANALFNIGDPDTIAEFVRVLRGGEFYHYLIPTGRAESFIEIQKPIQILWNQLLPGEYVLLLIGLLVIRRGTMSLYMLSIALFNMLFIAVYRVDDIADFSLPMLLVAWIIIAHGIAWLAEHGFRRLTPSGDDRSSTKWGRLLILLLLITGVAQLFLYRKSRDLSKAYYPQTFVKSIQKALPHNAFLINNMGPVDWQKVAPLWYQRYCHKERLDLTIFDDSGYWKIHGGYPPDNSFILHYDPVLLGRYKLQPHGPVWKLIPRVIPRPSPRGFKEIIDIRPYTNADYQHDAFTPNPEIGENNYFPNLKAGIINWKGVPFKLLEPYNISAIPSIISTCFDPGFHVAIPLIPKPSSALWMLVDGGVQRHKLVTLAKLTIETHSGRKITKEVSSFKDVTEYFNYKNGYPVPKEKRVFGERENESLSALRIKIPDDEIPSVLHIESGHYDEKEEWYPGMAIFAVTQVLTEKGKSHPDVEPEQMNTLWDISEGCTSDGIHCLNLAPYANADYRHNIFIPVPEIGKAVLPDLSPGCLFWADVPLVIPYPYAITSLPSTICLRKNLTDTIRIPLLNKKTQKIVMAYIASLPLSEEKPVGTLDIHYANGAIEKQDLIPGESIFDHQRDTLTSEGRKQIIWGPMNDQSVYALEVSCRESLIPDKIVLSLYPSEPEVDCAIAVLAISQVYAK